MRLIAVPCALVPACLLFGACAAMANGLTIARAAALVLAICAMACALLPVGRPLAWRSARELAACPVAWGVAALAWQAATWAVLAPVHVPGLPWLLDRVAALALAGGVWMACARARGDTASLGWGLAASGAVVLLITGIERCGEAWPQASPGTTVSGCIARCCAALGRDAPFGNQIFDLSAALPLLGIALVLLLRERRWPAPPWLGVLVVLGWICALDIAAGVRLDGSGAALPIGAVGRWLHAHGIGRREGVAGAGLELASAAALLLVLSLPRRWHAAVAMIGMAALLLALALWTFGALPPPGHSPSMAQRPWLWRCAAQAIASHPIAGYGLGSAVDVLDRQDAYNEAFLTIPSYPEHAHDEALECMLDGGLVNLGLIGGLLATTLLPLWRRRDQAACAALLVAWAMLMAHSFVDVELSQTGPVLMLALLAGVSWHAARDQARPGTDGPSDESGDRRGARWRQALPLLAGGALLAFTVLELTGRTGTTTELQERLNGRLAQCGEPDGRPALVEGLIATIGPLCDLECLRANLELQRQPPRLALAREACLRQSSILPIQPENVLLLVLLQRISRDQGDEAAAAALAERVRQCQRRMRACLERVPGNVKNQAVRARIQHLVDLGPALLDMVRSAPAQGLSR
jgi:hypothetical protein